MHEWALAEAVAETLRKEIQKRPGSKLASVSLLLGELQSMDVTVFRAGLSEFLEDLPISEDKVRITYEKASFFCNSCDARWELESSPLVHEEEKEAIHFLPEAAHAFVKCPCCGSCDFRIERGRGVVIQAIEFLVAP